MTRIAIIGTGISGLSCAWLLNNHHDLTIYESADRIGGHTATIDVKQQSQSYAIDTGFIVFNDWTYPKFISLLNRLGVHSQATNMSFSVNCKKTGIEYSGSGFNGLFAQRKNVFRLTHLRMLKDIVGFNRRSIDDLEKGLIPEDLTLGEYIKNHCYSKAFRDLYLLPMCSAIWSASIDDMLRLPMVFFVRFFKNHGLLNITDRPQWRTIQGGSRSYLDPLTKNFKNRIQLNSNIHRVTRNSDHVAVHFDNGALAQFDEIVFACHSDQALQLLGDSSEEEHSVLSAIAYQKNEVVLHTDKSILPQCRRAWASWNYHINSTSNTPAALSYNMNILQNLRSQETFIVTLNASHMLDKSKIVRSFEYAHPIFSNEGIQAQSQWQRINGKNRTWYCGAYWGNGFHEDGCASAERVSLALGGNRFD